MRQATTREGDGRSTDTEKPERRRATTVGGHDRGATAGGREAVAGGREAVATVRRRPGRPLSPPVRGRLESRFDADLDDVRVHAGPETATAARRIGASAYAVGADVVLADEGPATTAGARLLTHEVAHVVQTDGRAPTPSRALVVAAGTPAERAATRLARRTDAKPPAAGTAPPGVYRVRDETLSIILQQIRHMPPGESPEASARVILEAVMASDLDVTDDATVRALASAVAESKPQALTIVLAGLEHLRRRRAREAARMEATLGAMQPRRHGIYGTVTPGVAFPVIAGAAAETIPAAGRLAAAAFGELLTALANAFGNAGAFVEALVESLKRPIDDEVVRRLAERLLGASVLNVVFPAVFLAGAVVGIGLEVKTLVEGVVDLFQNYQEIIDAVIEVAEVMFTPAGEPLARAFGGQVGEQMRSQIVSLSEEGNVFTFTYKLGQIVGPTLVEIVLAFLLPGAVVASAFRRLLRGLLDHLPTVARLVRRLRPATPDLPGGTTGGADAPTTTPESPTEGVSTPETPSTATTSEAPMSTPGPMTTAPEPTTSAPEPTTPEAPAISAPEPTVSTPEAARSTPEASGGTPPTPGQVPGIEELGREAYIAYIKRTQPGIDSNRQGLYSRDGDPLTVSDDGAVLYENPGGTPTPCYSCDPVYVQEGGRWRRRPESEIPPSRRRGRTAPVATTPATPAQIARIRELAPPWLRNSRYWDDLGQTLDAADARDLVIPALERFRGVTGFRTVLLNLLSGGTGRQGAQFVLRYALRHVADPDAIDFEFPRRIGVLDPDAAPGERWGELGRDVDVVLRGPGVRVELKSWGPESLRINLNNPDDLHRQLALDLAESQNPREVRWVFDAGRLLTEPAKTRRVLGIDEGTELTPAVMERAIADRLRESLSTELDPTTNTGLLSEMMAITGGGILDDIVRVE